MRLPKIDQDGSITYYCKPYDVPMGWVASEHNDRFFLPPWNNCEHRVLNYNNRTLAIIPVCKKTGARKSIDDCVNCRDANTVVSNSMPSIASQAIGLVKSAVEFISNPGLVDGEILVLRLETCEKCERNSGGRCLECGCFVKIKTQGKAWSCPLGKWEQNKSKGE